MSCSIETEKSLGQINSIKRHGNVFSRKTSLQFLLVGSELLVLYLMHQWLDFQNVNIARQALMYVMLCIIFGHFSITTNLVWQEAQLIIKCNSAFLVSLIVMSPLKTLTITYLLKYAVMCAAMVISSLTMNRLYRKILRRRIASHVLVIGADENAKSIIDVSLSSQFTLIDIKAQLECTTCKSFRNTGSNQVKTDRIPIYDFDQLDEVLKLHQIDEVLVALPQASKEEMSYIMNSLHNKVKIIKFMPRVNGLMTFDSKVEDFDGILVVSSSLNKINLLDRLIKRSVDIVAGLVGCLLNIPLYLAVKYMNIKAGDHDPILFKQIRIGENGESITIYKYRSMVPNAEAVLEKMMVEDPKIREEYLTNKKLENDPRITKVGCFLRRTSLDEFPQFFNVLIGEMSLVGPRPYLPREQTDMGFYYDSIIKCKPGITGMWQTHGRSDVSFEQRCKLDDYYYKNWTIWLDFTILFKTLKAVIYERGAV